MNRRKEPVSARAGKKIEKEVHKGIKADSQLSTQTMKVIQKKAVQRISTHKKQSKRTAPQEKIEGSVPAHVHTENEHWRKAIQKQSLLQANRLQKKLVKRPSSR